MKRCIPFIICLFLALNVYSQSIKHLVILHTNDTHSRIEPYPASASRNANMAGAVRQAAYINEVRKENPCVLLFHSGDFVQGTPYFNLFKGELEVSLLNKMKYDAACLGNHEFDYGYPVLEKIVKQAKFPVISTNYDFSATPLKGKTKNYLIIKRCGLKIGVIGIGIDPEGLISKPNYIGMKFLSPLELANKTASFLKEKENCDLIICLSHLGYYPSENKFGDISLAKQSKNIDIILGGHSHTFLQRADRRMNLNGEEVVISQMGKDGIYVGRLDIELIKH